MPPAELAAGVLLRAWLGSARDGALRGSGLRFSVMVRGRSGSGLLGAAFARGGGAVAGFGRGTTCIVGTGDGTAVVGVAACATGGCCGTSTAIGGGGLACNSAGSCWV